ncbi:hypothetical protein B0H12DRAFT_82707 [Mycena haematopus]|nr:hypothetical protein B0H12DRAFT_82707 [Mycena haematopus]
MPEYPLLSRPRTHHARDMPRYTSWSNLLKFVQQVVRDPYNPHPIRLVPEPAPWKARATSRTTWVPLRDLNSPESREVEKLKVRSFSWVENTQTRLRPCPPGTVRRLRTHLALDASHPCIQHLCGHSGLTPSHPRQVNGRDLPPEILSEIFRICAEANFSDDCGSSDWKTPLALGQICRYWRTVALSTPRLWCNIAIVLEEPSASENVVPPLKLFLERSGRCPLTVVVGSDWTCKHDLRSYPMLKELMKASDRWEDANLSIPPSLLLEMAPTIKGGLGRLRTLKIFPNLGLSHYHRHPDVDAFQIAPLLDTVQVAMENDVTILLPSKQVTYYRSTCNNLLLLSRTLNNMQNLVVCYLELEFMYSVAEQIRLPNLRTLQITVDTGIVSGPGHSAVLDAFILPALTILRIRCYEDDRFIVPNLIAMVDRSLCALQKVSVEMPAEIPLDILRFLEYTLKLTNL